MRYNILLLTPPLTPSPRWGGDVPKWQKEREGRRFKQDERVRQEDAEADALPDDPKDPAWDDRKFFYLENAHAFRRIENYLLKLQLEKQKELSRLSAAYEYQRKKKK